MRRIAAVGVAGVALAAPGLALAEGATLSLRTDRPTARYGTVIRFSGGLSPAAPGAPVRIYRVVGDRTYVLIRGVLRDDGTFGFRMRMRKPGRFVARTKAPGTNEIVQSRPVTVRVRPLLSTRFAGSAVLGGTLWLRGTIWPARSGVLRRTIRGITRRVAVGRYGHFRVSLPTGRPAVRVRVFLTPSAGFARTETVRHKALALPSLRQGSKGAGVALLERRLRAQQYAIRGVDRVYASDTTEAVWAFQKVHGLARTGRVGKRFWRRLARSHTPLARVRRGNHIEISKTRQTIYEVRRGQVVNVLHTSTGVTGNTPVGTWRVYYKVPGFNAKQMYFSLFFLRGFAIHGYHSVPPYPASHGCARIPLWAAHGLYRRWGYGSTVIVFG